MRLILLLFLSLLSLFANPLQEAIDTASPYDTLKLNKGLYQGNVVIDKPLTIVGKEDGVVIRGDRNGSVISIRSSFVTLKNLTITHSGENFFSIDSAIQMSHAKACVVDNCTLKDTLYGIDMNMVSDSNISNNHITSNGKEIEFRGNALKLYYAHHNHFLNNTIVQVKDVTLNYSNHNVFEKNRFENNRFATHLSLSHDNLFKNNFYQYNSVAIMLMGAKDTMIVGNQILSSKGAAGIGAVIKGVSNFHFEQNRVKFNAKGLYIDGGEKDRSIKKGKDIKRYLINNEIAYNKEAIHFHQSIKNNLIRGNRIVDNIDDIVKDLPSEPSTSNTVEHNYWDKYEGFDRDGDNIGDTPHQIYQYADSLWEYHPKLKFFYASPLMSLLNFMSRLAPFIEPNLLLEDSEPIVEEEIL